MIASIWAISARARSYSARYRPAQSLDYPILGVCDTELFQNFWKLRSEPANSFSVLVRMGRLLTTSSEGLVKLTCHLRSGAGDRQIFGFDPPHPLSGPINDQYVDITQVLA